MALLLVTSCSDDDPAYKPDTTPPAILSGPTVSDIAQSSARVSWTTDDRSTSVVEFTGDRSFADGPYPGLGPRRLGNPSLVHEHSLVMTDTTGVYGAEMEPGTLFYYHVASQNAAGMITWSSVDSFTTLP
jgi:hypothetical protein